MEDFLAVASAGYIIAIIIAILPFIAIIGTWNNSVKIRKHLDDMDADLEDTRKHLEVMEADLKHTNELLKNIGRVLVEIKTQGYSSNIPQMSNAGFQPAETETEQQPPERLSVRTAVAVSEVFYFDKVLVPLLPASYQVCRLFYFVMLCH